MNDEINKLMREKRHWEVQIKSLGGPDHARVGPKMLDQDGKEVPGNRGYKYFGAAKDLPGIIYLDSDKSCLSVLFGYSLATIFIIISISFMSSGFRDILEQNLFVILHLCFILS